MFPYIHFPYPIIHYHNHQNVEYQQMQQAQNELGYRRREIAREMQEIAQKRYELSKERQQIAIESNKIKSEREALKNEREEVCSEFSKLLMKRQELAQEREKIAKELDEIAEQREEVSHKRKLCAIVESTLICVGQAPKRMRAENQSLIQSPGTSNQINNYTININGPVEVRTAAVKRQTALKAKKVAKKN